MSDLSLDLGTRDLAIGTDGTVALVDGTAELVQRCAIVLRLQRGLWPFDTSAGVPWRERILVRSPDLSAIASTIRAALLAVPGVERVDVSGLEIDGGTLRGAVVVNGNVGVAL